MTNDDKNISIGSSILAIWLITTWGFGIVLSTNSFDKILSIVFPPYGMLMTFEWLIEIINKIINN